MAEQDDSDKTEEPTGKKKSEARNKGMVGKSMDFSSAAVLLAGTMLIWLFDDQLVGGMEKAMIESFRAIGTFERIPLDLLPIARESFFGFLALLMPVVCGIAVFSVIINIGQV